MVPIPLHVSSVSKLSVARLAKKIIITIFLESCLISFTKSRPKTTPLFGIGHFSVMMPNFKIGTDRIVPYKMPV